MNYSGRSRQAIRPGCDSGRTKHKSCKIPIIHGFRAEAEANGRLPGPIQTSRDCTGPLEPIGS